VTFDKTTREQVAERLNQIVLQDWIRQLIQQEVEKFEQQAKETKALSAGAS
jgi:hypothetical protein